MIDQEGRDPIMLSPRPARMLSMSADLTRDVDHSTTSDDLARLPTRAEPEVRAAVATHRHTSPKTLRALTRDPLQSAAARTPLDGYRRKNLEGAEPRYRFYPTPYHQR